MSNDVHSPDGALEVAFQSSEVRMSHWINSPRVIFRGDILLDLWASEAWGWDAVATFDVPGTVTLHLRKYPGTDPAFDIRIDAGARTWEVLRGQCPEEMKRWLGKELTATGCTPGA